MVPGVEPQPVTREQSAEQQGETLSFGFVAGRNRGNDRGLKCTAPVFLRMPEFHDSSSGFVSCGLSKGTWTSSVVLAPMARQTKHIGTEGQAGFAPRRGGATGPGACRIASSGAALSTNRTIRPSGETTHDSPEGIASGG